MVRVDMGWIISPMWRVFHHITSNKLWVRHSLLPPPSLINTSPPLTQTFLSLPDPHTLLSLPDPHTLLSLPDPHAIPSHKQFMRAILEYGGTLKADHRAVWGEHSTGDHQEILHGNEGTVVVVPSLHSCQHHKVGLKG